MSLLRDYNHYYQQSWVGVKEGNLLLPVFVEQVLDSSDYDSDDYSEEHRARLEIHGHRYVKNNRGRVVSSRFSISVLDDSLVLESPDVGYISNGRDVRWAVIRPVRQRMKGMVSNKLAGMSLGRSQENATLVYNLFNPEFDGMINRYLFVAPSTGYIYYKGAQVGVIADGSISIISRFSYLLPMITVCEQYRDLPVTPVEAL